MTATETRSCKPILGGKPDYVEVRGLGENFTVDFPSGTWLAFASVRFLPPAGYRVHIIIEPFVEPN
jgi:hypothetical protein